MASEYVTPDLVMETSYEALRKDFGEDGPMAYWGREDRKLSIDDLLLQDFVFVVGEPGQGKSRLLRELAGHGYTNNGLGYSIVNLSKLVRNQTLEDALAESEEQKQFDITKAESTLVCLDALDEVPSSRFSETVQLIKRYIKTHPDHKVIVTSRIHFFTKYESSFAGINATYALLLALSHEQQLVLLKQHGLTDEQISLAFRKLKTADRATVLQTPRYLEYFAQWYKSHGSSERLLSRSDIFNHFVDESLKTEDDKVSKKIAPLRRRTLEKLALVMEIAQVNSISQDDMITFIEEYRSESKMLLLSTSDDLESLYNHGLLKDDGENISFDNAELQEYLAASAINRMDNVGNVAFDLAVDKNQRSIHPSWYSALSFLLEMHPELLDQILDLDKSTPDNPSRPQDPDTHKLISGVNADLIPVEQRNEIFKRILNYYNKNKIYLRYDVANRLAFYATPESEALLKKHAEEFTDRMCLVNIAEVVGNIKRIGLLKDEAYWKDKLRQWALDKNTDEHASVLTRQSLYALEYFDDSTLIKDLNHLQDHEDELVRRAYIQLCESIDANDPLSVAAIIKATKANSFDSRQSLEKITSKAALTTLLDSLASDTVFLKEMVDHDSMFDKGPDKLLTNIEKVLDEELLKKAKAVIEKIFDVDSGYYAERSKFIAELIVHIAKHDPNYFADMLSWAVATTNGYRLYYVQQNLARVMQKADLKIWNEKIKEFPDVSGQTFRIVVLLDDPNVNNPNAKDILKQARIDQPELFKIYDGQVQKSKLRQQRDKLKDEFDDALNIAKQDKNVAALNRALEIFNKEKNLKRFDKNADSYLWSLSKSLVLDQFDPAQATFKLHKKNDDGSQPFTISSFIQVYGEVAVFAHKTNRSIDGYRDKFIALLAFTYNDETQACLELLGSISPQEADQLISIFKDPSSDRARHNPSNFVEAVKRFRTTDSVEVLNKFVDEPSFNNYLRREALELSENLRPSKERLQQIFASTSDERQGESLKIAANRFLISNHHDKDAIGWLMTKIKDSAVEFIEATGSHSVGPVEHELHGGETSKPLGELADESFINDYLELLEFSFELYGRGKAWHAYAFYVWKIIEAYFMQLKDSLRFEPLEKLEYWMSQHNSLPGVNLFKDRLVEIRRAYAKSINQPKNINQAIRLAEKARDEDKPAINTAGQLKSIIEKVIRERLIPWIEAEAVKILDETHAQKLIKIQLENFLMKEMANSPQLQICHILREAQALDDTRTDFLIYHGFVGPVIIELKLFSNGDLTGVDLTKNKSYASLKNYMQQYQSNEVIFLALDDDLAMTNTPQYQKKLTKITEAYHKINGVTVMGARLPDRKPKTPKKAPPKKPKGAK